MARWFGLCLVSVALAGCSNGGANKSAGNLIGTWASTDGLYEWTFSADGQAVEYAKKPGEKKSYKYEASSGHIDVTRSSTIKGVYEFDGPDTLQILFGVGGKRPKSIHETGSDVHEMLTLKRK